MAEFQELIKNFERIRDYMRQFYIYGFKVRVEYNGKSARTYDNERRRIESWLSEYIKSGYTSKGKQVYINVDSKTVSQNPLYAAWKAKSFTDNDIMLHFFILDQLWGIEEGMSAGMLGDRIAESCGVVFDSQTLRLKLKEYEELGILSTKKRGKTLAYFLSPCLMDGGEKSPKEEDSGRQMFLTAVKFYQEAAPFGFIGSTILDREDKGSDRFQFKHHFIVHTLEDGILMEILESMREQKKIRFINKSCRGGKEVSIEGLPLRIFVSTRTGRRYMCCYLEKKRRFVNYRLDCISKVKRTEKCSDYLHWRELLQKNLERCWGVSFGGIGRLEEISMKVYIDEKKEPYILNRLCREGHGGNITKTGVNEYLYEGTFFDTNEMLPWMKSLLADRRIGLFLSDSEKAYWENALKDAEPLFSEEDFYYFDRYSDGDNYDSEQYRENFRTILSALEKGQALFIAYEGKQGDTVTYETLPYQLQYSSKDDKFRLCSRQYVKGGFSLELTLNLAGIRACHLSKREVRENPEDYRFRNDRKSREPVLLEISGERNSLERCMVHFANYEKHTEYDEEKNAYFCSIYYDRADETELLIDVLSFGPVIRVLGPDAFLNQVKARVRRQHAITVPG